MPRHEPRHRLGRWWGPGFALLPPAEPGSRLVAVDPPRGFDRAGSRAGWRVETVAIRPVAPPTNERDARHRERLAPPAVAWPVGSDHFDVAIAIDVLEHVIDDRFALIEAGRVVRAGGLIVVRVPARGPLAWLDPFNLYRYLSDATRRGPSPPETWGIGWRRHYSRRELERLLREAGFEVVAVTGTGLGLAPALDLAMLLLFRWLLPLEPVYRQSRHLTGLVTALDRHLPLGLFGYWLTIVARRSRAPSPGSSR